MLHFDCCLCGQEYARNIIARLDPDTSLIKYRFYREACRGILRTDANKKVMIKDLSCIGWNLSSLVLVDNCPKVTHGCLSQIIKVDICNIRP
jgi:TFIIF-interacting CTD phosphatase-like protein